MAARVLDKRGHDAKEPPQWASPAVGAQSQPGNG
jgi:hypothetical protein